MASTNYASPEVTTIIPEKIRDGQSLLNVLQPSAKQGRGPTPHVSEMCWPFSFDEFKKNLPSTFFVVAVKCGELCR